ncbi:MAG: zinc ribbon domain-containing protein [Bacteroidetes bacterium]|nr:MAG: zinc ribbon domain-containing protein [Bacteroidota bacterium]
MNRCPNCAAELIPGAKFCHRCGDRVVEKTKQCPACHEANPLASVFCHHCGHHFDHRRQTPPAFEPRYHLDFDPDLLTEQIKSLFFRSLRGRVEEEYDPDLYSAYVERFYQSKFREVYAVRSGQIAQDVLSRWERFGTEGLPDIDRYIERSFDGLLDYFTIQFCPDLSQVLLPSAILKYEHATPAKTDLWQMIQDYLDFEHEDETLYFNFISMPGELISNACKNYLTAQGKEKVYFICDLSIKGTCKEGFAMTDKGLYWRAPFSKGRCVLYADLRTLEKGKDWLTINGHFFTTNPSLNLKLYKLLKKLRSWETHAIPT